MTETKPEAAPTTALADGEWHRLHPATPLLRGGIALIAILGIFITNFLERFVQLFVGDQVPYGGEFSEDGDPIRWILDNGYIGAAIAAIAVGLVLFIAGFYVSWRMHTFRITDEVVEVRSGILFRTNRRGRLDRIQGINIVRPFIARLFGAAKLEVNVAGQDANVQLSYLSSSNADDLRRDILLLASGTQARDDAARAPQGGTLLDRRVAELLAPELDPNAAPPESVVKLSVGRLVGSILLNDSTLFLVLAIAGYLAGAIASGELLALFGVLPIALGIGSFMVSRFTKSLRYSIAGTPDGVRVGFGLLSTSNETLPPGRIHSVQVSQPLLWRAPGWWEVKVNRASKSSTQGASGQQNTTILPVGNLDEVLRVLTLLLPGLAESQSLLRTGLVSKGPGEGFVGSPRRAAIIRWFSWKRNGFAYGPGVVLFRKGAIWRELVIVPEPRVQSIGLSQGPLYRRLGLAALRLHTVAGPITASLGAVDRDAALGFFSNVADAVIRSVSADTSHRWRSGEAPS